MNLTTKTGFLVIMSRLNPQMMDALIPHGPVISTGTRHVMASMIIKSVANSLTAGSARTELEGAGKKLFDSGVQTMSYDDDGWCGTPYPHRFPHIFEPVPVPWIFNLGREELMLNPQPLPPDEKAYYGSILTLLADAVTLEGMPEMLKKIGASMMEKSSRPIFDKVTNKKKPVK